MLLKFYNQATEEMAEQVIAAVLPKAVETVWDSAEASTCMDKNYSKFTAKLNTMRAVRDDLKDRSTKYKSTMKRTMDDWFQRVMDVENQAQKLESCFLAIQDTSAWRRVFSPSRVKLSRKMVSMCSDMDELVTQSTELGNTLIHKVVKRVVEMTTPHISYIQSQQDVLNTILIHLPNEAYRTIRVLGMLGVGKTVILKNLNNHEVVGSQFEKVIWVTVSREDNSVENLSTETLQHVIAERLIIDIEGATDVAEIARRIKEDLEGVKFLLLLDDVKENLDLEIIGIPNGAKGSKIVMTTKIRHVKFPLCHNIEVKKLSPCDSWNMYQKLLYIPNDITEKPQLERIARKTLDICDGLPLMIKMAARAFKAIDKTEQTSWSDGLQMFKQWPYKKDNNIMENLLKFCCDHLDHEQKHCFLYSSLHPEDTDISTEELLDCWAAENLLNSGYDAKIVGRNIMAHLKNVILLEEDTTGHFVRMHKVIRAIALRFLSEEMKDGCLVKTCEVVQETVALKRQRVDLWTDKKWISLANNSLDISYEVPHSFQLTTLFVQNYSKNKQIHDRFFQYMRSLVVLSLYKTELMTLPSSICNLSNLKILNLNGCTVLTELPGFIGKLKSLEVLDIRDSGVSKLPHSMEHLTHMRRLLVSFTTSTQDKYDAIFKLLGLDDLIIDVDTQMQNWCITLIEDLIKKVSSLTSVVTFQFRFHDKVIDVIQVVDDTVKIYIPNEYHLTYFLKRIQDPKTRSFQVYIGCFISQGIEFSEFYRYDRYAKYCNGTGGHHDVIKSVLTKVQAFELINHNDIEHLSRNVIESMHNVQGCLIQSCNKMITVVGDDCTRDGSLLPNLERLDLKNLPELKQISQGLVPLWSLSKLKALVLFKCPMMTVVFTGNIVQQLRELEYLEIEDCCRVKEIVSSYEGISPQFILKLTTLVLCNMPSLRSIFSMPSLERLKIHDCSKLKVLPFNNINTTKLQKLEVQKDWWEALQWADSNVKERLLPRCSFYEASVISMAADETISAWST
ncbi:disease resistance protein At4g27190-like [Rutidosis leptorrhynchoides]|uniref:disease resistance protein At4g27190-like n=1 Tax=Rutidosis leptorrhynchoides TaxID=125765 RepID=UPI003A998F6F